MDRLYEGQQQKVIGAVGKLPIEDISAICNGNFDSEKANVRESVMDCLRNIVDDYEYGVEHREYAIFVPIASFSGDEIRLGEHREVITKPKIVYRNIVLNGRDFVADYLTEKIYGKMQVGIKQ